MGLSRLDLRLANLEVSRLLQVAALKGTAAWDNTLVVFSPTQPPDTYLAILPRPGPHCMLLEP